MTLCSSGTGTCTSVWSLVSREILRTLTRLEKTRYVSGESSHDLPSPLSRMPVGQAQDVPLGRGRHRWVQPPFRLPHLLKPEEAGDRRIDAKRQRSTSQTTLPHRNLWVLAADICLYRCQIYHMSITKRAKHNTINSSFIQANKNN